MTWRAGRGRTAAAQTGALAVVVVFLAGCGSVPPDSGGTEHDDAAVSLEHIHGLGVNPADGTLYVGSHHGVFRVSGTGPPEQIAGRTQDFMGFTVVGPDHFLGSGHPGPDDADQPPHLGLLESTDAARTWTSVSLSGEADFHALEAKHQRVYGLDSQSRQIMVSQDRVSWETRARLAAADIAVSPVQPDVLLATTQDGLARSVDGGRTFNPIPSAPALAYLDWPTTERLVGVGPDGTVHTSVDGGATWARRGQAPGRPEAVTSHGTTEIYLATADGIHHSRDDGASFVTVQAL